MITALFQTGIAILKKRTIKLQMITVILQKVLIQNLLHEIA
ncbi:hypothetical protein BH10ACI1_BH10ACI1_31730 [soil metagenome]